LGRTTSGCITRRGSALHKHAHSPSCNCLRRSVAPTLHRRHRHHHHHRLPTGLAPSPTCTASLVARARRLSMLQLFDRVRTCSCMFICLCACAIARSVAGWQIRCALRGVHAQRRQLLVRTRAALHGAVCCLVANTRGWPGGLVPYQGGTRSAHHAHTPAPVDAHARARPDWTHMRLTGHPCGRRAACACACACACSGVPTARPITWAGEGSRHAESPARSSACIRSFGEGTKVLELRPCNQIGIKGTPLCATAAPGVGAVGSTQTGPPAIRATANTAPPDPVGRR